ncbi:carbohydrate ABC transporter permease [Burkholderia cepacia]|uniref:carbohydrate ABC transporter permease n=1 Tax=Burkholderia cepacia TaxID=292 RepID=UPI002AB617F6|nr:sugar ABC transporter permease [Burkholderia cepacia]
MSAHSLKRGATTQRARSQTAWPVLLTLPALVSMLALILIPAVSVMVAAFTDWQFGSRSFHFIGARNFLEVWTDPAFWQAAVNTVAYAAMVIPGTLLLGLAVALLIHSSSSLRRLYEAVHFIPVMATMAAMAIVWEAMLHPTIGLVNKTLMIFGLSGANWLRDPVTVLPTLAVIGIWQQFGFAMVLFLSGLRSIPQDLYDAARVDGASAPLDRFLTVTFPMLGPVSLFIAVITAIRSLQVFDTVQVLTQGGPDGASEVLLHRLYTESFGFLRTGYGAALTVVFMVAVVTLTLIQNRVLDKKVHYS